MCYTAPVEIPVVEARFFVDDCPCHASPRQMVEIWRPGERERSSTVFVVSDLKKQFPALWAAVSKQSQGVPLLITHQPLRPYVDSSYNADQRVPHQV